MRLIRVCSIALTFCGVLFANSVAHAGSKKISIDSVPEGAEVEVNGSVTCTTPCVLTVSDAYFGAKHTIFSSHIDSPMSVRLRRAGFVPKVASLTGGPHNWRSFDGSHQFDYYLIESEHFTLRLDPVQAFVGTVPIVETSEPISGPSSEGMSTELLVSKSLPAIVQVRTEKGSGSGFFITSEGLVATNAHVVGRQQSATVVTSFGQEFGSSNIYVDEDRDLALIKIDAHNVPFLEVSRRLPGQGADVVAIGTPGAHDADGTFMLPNSVTKGVVSGIRAFSDITVASIPGRAGNWIQTDATINHGNSGGPLLNRGGQVVGINTLSFSATGTPGINFALAAPELIRVVQERLGLTLGHASTGSQAGAAASPAKLTVTSTPPGADIEVDGVFLGNTPSEVSVAEGQRIIRITKKGFEPYQRTIQAQPNGVQRISAELDPIVSQSK